MIEAKKTKNIGTIKLGGQEYDILIAKSEEQKKRGLQGVLKLDKDEGMLFFINESEPVETVFHTQNMHFPIDMLFLDDEFNILDIKTEEPGKDQIKGIASYVLELAANSGIKKDSEIELDDEDTHEYVMKVLAPDGSSQMNLLGGERIISRRETIVVLKKALKAAQSKVDKDYKALGKYMFKVLSGQDSRKPEYVDAPDKKD